MRTRALLGRVIFAGAGRREAALLRGGTAQFLALPLTGVIEARREAAQSSVPAV